jgi:hypothetical protein
LSTRITGVGSSGAIEPIETGDIHNVPQTQLEPKALLLLKPSEVAVSLPSSTELPNAVAPLTTILGPRLTVDSPAWSGDPIPGMRMLQKTLLSVSLQQEQGDRADLLTAIELVEKAVQMRLRWQQMRRSDVEALIEPANEEKTCDQS